MQKPKIATVWLEGCAGCHMSLLDLDAGLLDLLAKIDLSDTPITDFKDFDFDGVSVGIIEGGIGNVEQEEIVKKLRQHSQLIVACGDCAVFGGINTLRNWIPTAEVLKRGYIETVSTIDGKIPDDLELPPLLEKVLPVDQVVLVDAHIPGCPPSPGAIAYCLEKILAGQAPELPADLIRFD